MKKIIAIISLILLVIIIYLLINYNSYERIKKYVINNQEKLLILSNKILNKEEIDKPYIVKQIKEYDDIMVEFSIFSIKNQYSGFYYSKENKPLAFQNADVELTKIEDNTWIWKSNGDNKGKIIKIIDNWFYYEANL